MRRRDEDALGLSFLDIICGGFGASLFLFIVFASLPIESTSGLSGSNQYVYISASWRDPNAVLDLRIKRPDGSTIRVNNPQYSLSTGSSRLLARAENIDGGAWKALHIFGIDPAGKLNARNVTTEQDQGALASRTFSAQILGPCPGEWTLTFDYVNRAGQRGWFTSINDTVTLDVRIHSSDYKAPLARPIAIGFGDSRELYFEEEQSGTTQATFITSILSSEDYSHCH